MRISLSTRIKSSKDAKKNFEDNPAPTEKGLIQQRKNIDKLESELIVLEKTDAKLRDEPVRGVLAEKMYEVDLVISQHKQILKDSEAAIKFETENAALHPEIK